LFSAKDVKLVDAEVVNNTASPTINGTDTNNIAATNPNAKRRCSDRRPDAARVAMSVPIPSARGCGFEVAGEVVEVAGGGGDLDGGG